MLFIPTNITPFQHFWFIQTVAVYCFPGSPFRPRVGAATSQRRGVSVVGGWESLLDANNRMRLTLNETKRIEFDIRDVEPGQWIAYRLNIDWISAELNVGWMSFELRLNVGKMSVECRLNVGWMSVECRLNVGWMFVECRLNVGWMSIECNQFDMSYRTDAIELSLFMWRNTRWRHWKCVR